MAASEPSASATAPQSSFFVEHEFLIRRLHSFTGLLAGGFMLVHLTVNASVANSPATFQNNVYLIHSLGKILPLVEWAFIFAPLLFHSIVGVWIAKSSSPNTANYRYGSNYRYAAQRITGYILFAYVLYHVFHMHGWFHFGWWLSIVDRMGGAQFAPYNATSTAAIAMDGWFVTLIYAIGVLSGVFHFANGLWTAGITWGAWVTPRAQANALRACTALGVAVSVIGLTSIVALRVYANEEKIAEIQAEEERMYEARVAAGSVVPNDHKRAGHHDHDEEETETALLGESP
ncbi:MAG: succinate dehydrogenase cytochrome b558 subunit [Planctomycetota bacterium]